MTEEDVAIKEIQAERNVESNLSQIIDKHSGIFIEMVKHYVPENSEYSNRDDLLSEKDYHIYKAIKSFDFSKNVKFVTHLGNQAKYLCLNTYNKNKKKLEINCEEMKLDWISFLSEEEHMSNMIKSDSKELFKKINNYLENHKDERVKKIFELRYFSYKDNKIKPWRLIYREIGMSIQGCINLHKKTIKELRRIVKVNE
jgi:DNA-directed RNA polymerase sigma subunit (sigma70/sigma32)